MVPYEIAGAVGVAAEADPFEALAVGIGDRPGLLVLDTCEHLVDACATAAHRLLRDCPALTVLATSRQPLAVAGEVAWPVPPLGLSHPGASLQEIKESEAVRLFRDRARAARPGFEVDETNAANVADICRVLDGLPLAIELAAARIKVLSPAAILARLDDRFALLHKVGPAADVRQQSLRAAIQWSYDLLDDEHRRFFDRLGVFAGRFSLDAAARVAGDGLGERSAGAAHDGRRPVARRPRRRGQLPAARLPSGVRRRAARRRAGRRRGRPDAHGRLAGRVLRGSRRPPAGDRRRLGARRGACRDAQRAGRPRLVLHHR